LTAWPLVDQVSSQQQVVITVFEIKSIQQLEELVQAAVHITHNNQPAWAQL
jgi:thiamine pyrophosphate-dependent acetolactate synthase large subunit-like protein